MKNRSYGIRILVSNYGNVILGKIIFDSFF